MRNLVVSAVCLCLAAALARAGDSAVIAADPGDVTGHPIEHASFVLEAGDTRIAFDPVGGGDRSPALDDVDLVLVTEVRQLDWYPGD